MTVQMFLGCTKILDVLAISGSAIAATSHCESDQSWEKPKRAVSSRVNAIARNSWWGHSYPKGWAIDSAQLQRLIDGVALASIPAPRVEPLGLWPWKHHGRAFTRVAMAEMAKKPGRGRSGRRTSKWMRVEVLT